MEQYTKNQFNMSQQLRSVIFHKAKFWMDHKISSSLRMANDTKEC